MNSKMSAIGGKKTLLVLGFSAGMFLIAGTAFGATYAPDANQVQAQTGQTTLGQAQPQAFAVPVDTSGDFWFARGGQTGMMRVAGGSQYPPMMQFGFNNNIIAWYQLMHIITMAMVWVVLLLLIGYLWKLNKKHK